ncbi:tetratricopeptide repeat protein [Catelliglobosispora koreensis]|uniref:tetratricopeptide repeat protein n=1 Tax=Catelliglobosispora koreensis TaxID=129052 RepID=UPI00037ADDDD|nr:tetratricopeptide repeat protein [Catelliglobosispora koreensis]
MRVLESKPDFSTIDALLLSGDIDGLLDEFADLGDRLPAGMAWRVGLTHYLLRGSPRDALRELSKGDVGAEKTADEAILLGWLASVHWALGDLEACTRDAERAFLAAQASGSCQAKAAAQVSLGLRAMLAGDRVGNAAHYAKALRYASAAADSLQIIRVRMNRAAHFGDEGNYREALDDLAEAVKLATEIGNPVLLGVALTNEGDTFSAMGQLGEAVSRFHQATQLFQQAGSGKVSFSLLSLGDVQRRRGQLALAQAAYEETIPLAEAHGHTQVLVAALAGLAETVCEADPETGLQLASRAHKEAVGPFTTVALLALAKATLASGDVERAGQLAIEAQRSARAHRDRASIARALELQAQVCADWERAGRYLAEARGIWIDLGSAFDAERVTVVLGDHSPLAVGPVAIRTLGRFEVSVGGKPLPPSAWQSRKARDLLRLLVGRRGRPIAREELVDLLWADEQGVSTEKRLHRLAVALSIVRGVVDGPRQSSSDSVVLADGSSIALDTSRMNIDLETFIRQAEHGLRLHRAGKTDDGLAVLIGAERRYTGDFMEDEPYEAWTRVPRELARATYLRVGRVLAEAALRRCDTDEAIHYLLRILAVDGYDEQTHLDLIESYAKAGRHGEVRRARERYAGAMAELGVTV